MKILFVHADYMNYKLKERTKFAEKVEEGREVGDVKDPLISFICIEKSDENASGADKEALAEIRDVASKVGAKNIVIFPFAHLSFDLASPAFAVKLLTDLERSLKEGGYKALRVPFGWYKAFEFRSKGHPLAVLSRSLSNQPRHILHFSSFK